jgi:endonuclease/exonuclease/phosphatase family metal-dependent hydrolase
MRTKLRSKTGDIDLGRKRSKAEQCQSSGRRCKYRRRHANVTNTPTSGAKLRVATYNVHGCMGMDRQRSEARIAEVIAEMSVDIVALQELDLGRRRSAGADQTKMIAEQLGWYSHFHPAMRRNGEHYGNAIISRYQLTFRRGVELPGRPPFFCRENRAAIEVNIETNLGKIHIINTHLGLGWRERLLQAQLFTSAEWRAAIAGDTPLILLGDFNSLRDSRPYRTINRHLRDVREFIQATGPIRTFPTRLPMLAVDHIFINGAVQPLSLTVHRSPLARIASDHFPLIAEFVLSRHRCPE